VFYQEDTQEITFKFSGSKKRVVAVDTQKAYKELSLGKMNAGSHTFQAPHSSNWVLYLSDL
ncbi:MAG: hypothetical protein AAGI07_10835, partial [Bacteroidota bacterium]